MNIDDDDDKRLEQGFFCHYDCIKGAVELGDYLNLEDQAIEEG